MDKVDVRGIDDEERSVGVAKEKLIIGFIHAGDVIEVDLFLEGPAALPDAAKQGVGVRLEKDHQVGTDDLRFQYAVKLLIERQFFIIEVQVLEDPVLVKQLITDRDARKEIRLRHFPLLAEPAQEKEHLRLEPIAFGVTVKIGEKGIVFRAFKDQAGIEFFGEKGCEAGLADADGAFGYDVSSMG